MHNGSPKLGALMRLSDAPQHALHLSRALGRLALGRLALARPAFDLRFGALRRKHGWMRGASFRARFLPLLLRPFVRPVFTRSGCALRKLFRARAGLVRDGGAAF